MISCMYSYRNINLSIMSDLSGASGKSKRNVNNSGSSKNRRSCTSSTSISRSKYALIDTYIHPVIAIQYIQYYRLYIYIMEYHSNLHVDKSIANYRDKGMLILKFLYGADNSIVLAGESIL